MFRGTNDVKDFDGAVLDRFRDAYDSLIEEIRRPMRKPEVSRVIQFAEGATQYIIENDITQMVVNLHCTIDGIPWMLPAKIRTEHKDSTVAFHCACEDIQVSGDLTGRCYLVTGDGQPLLWFDTGCGGYTLHKGDKLTIGDSELI